MTLYAVRGEYIVEGDRCACPHCPGHSEKRKLILLVDADNQREAENVACADYNHPWISMPRAREATLKDVEQYTLAQWRAGDPIRGHVNALARARGEIADE